MSKRKHDETLRSAENPYEAVVLAAREAVRINARRAMAPVPGEVEDKPTSLAIERVANGEATARTEDAKDKDGEGDGEAKEAEAKREDEEPTPPSSAA